MDAKTPPRPAGRIGMYTANGETQLLMGARDLLELSFGDGGIDVTMIPSKPHTNNNGAPKPEQPTIASDIMLPFSTQEAKTTTNNTSWCVTS